MASRYNSRRGERGRPPATPSRRWSTVTQPQGKANYRPMTSNMSRRPSRQQPQQQPIGEDSIKEAEGNVPIQTRPKENVHRKRYTYREPSDPKVAAEMSVLTKYIKDKNLMTRMMASCQALLQRDSLPYNPYPELVSKMRQEAERFHMFGKTSKAIKGELSNKVQPTTTPHIYGVKGYSSAWGLEAVVHAVSVKSLQKYDQLVADVSPTKIVLSDEQQEYNGQILVAMLGPAAFWGTVYQEAPSVDLRLEYVIYGPDLQTALLVFINCISEDIRQHLSSDTPHRIMGILVPGSKPSDMESNPNSRGGFWRIEQARGQWDEFWDAVREAVMDKQPVIVMYTFLLDKETNDYRIGSKEFILHYIQTSDETSEEIFTSFAPLPYQTLYEGIFLKKAHAEAYVGTLKRHQEATASQSGARPSQGNRHRQSIEAGLVSEQDEERDDVIRIEDIVLADRTRNPIRETWQRRIASLHPVRDAFKIAHLTLLLALSDGSVESIEVKMELYRFSRSTAAALNVVMLLLSNLRLLAATTSMESNDDRRFLTHQVTEFKRKLLAVLDPKLHARSSEFHVAHDVLSKLLQGIAVLDPSDSRTLKSMDLVALQHVQDYTTTLQLLLTEDAMSFFKRLNFKTLVRGCKEAFELAGESTRDVGRKKVEKSTKSSTSVTTQPAIPIKTNHGTETKEITQQKNIVIDVEEVKSLSNWPRIMVTEAVLMQYMVDVKLDVVWHSYLLKLLMGDHLPPNPYPGLVTALRQAAYRMQLCSETDSTLTSKLLPPEQTRLQGQSHPVHAVANVGAFGLSRRTLAGVDTEPGAFVKLVKIADPLANREVVTRKGQFQIEVSQALGGTGAFYGRLVPYLNTLHLYDHYYIRGSIGADSDAIQLYAKLVYEYIIRMVARKDYVIIGVYFDGGGHFMSEADLEADKATFFSNVVDAARRKQDVYLKVYRVIGWRYLCLHKHFVLHYLFVDDIDDRHVCYSPDDPSSAYQYVFLSQGEAMAHYRGSETEKLGNIEGATRMGTVNDYLNQEIEGALEEHRVTWAYELILRKGFINKDAKLVAQAWRMLHSPAYQLEYIQTLNRDLQTLLGSALASPERLGIRADSSNQSLAKGRGNKAKTEGGGDVGNQPQGLLSTTTLGRFISVYADKLSDVLQEPCAFVPSSLLEMIQEKLERVNSMDGQTQRPAKLIEQRTVATLKEIHRLLQPVQDWVSYDVHQALSKQDTLMAT